MEKHTESSSFNFCSDSHKTTPHMLKIRNRDRTLCLVCFSTLNQIWVSSQQSLNHIRLPLFPLCLSSQKAESRWSFVALRTHSTWGSTQRKQSGPMRFWLPLDVVGSGQAQIVQTLFPPAFSVIHSWSDWSKRILIPSLNGCQWPVLQVTSFADSTWQMTVLLYIMSESLNHLLNWLF